MQFNLVINMNAANVSSAANVALLLRQVAEHLEALHNDKNSEPPILWWDDKFSPITSIDMFCVSEQVGQWEFLGGEAPLVRTVSE